MSTFPGAIGVSRLRVYDWPADDGLRGGSPHLHTASAEGYLVIGGRGAVETVTSHGAERTDLGVGTVLWFTPGTVHRLINRDGALEIVTLMQNAGLPEAGDAVFTFPLSVLRDAEEYRSRAALPDTDDITAMESAALARRDLALRGYRELLDRGSSDMAAALADVHAAAAALVAPQVQAWRRIHEAGPREQVIAAERQLDSLAAAAPGALADAAVHVTAATPGPERWGMCGRLTVWPLEAPAPGSGRVLGR